MTALQTLGRPGAGAREGLRSTLARELNAIFAIAWREILRAVKSPVSLALTIIFPIIFMGILGGSISQNLGGALPYAYLPFMLIGMIANTLYQGTITGVTNLVEERENDFTAELFVAPISRYAVLIGKIVGSALAALISLVGILGMVVVMQIPLDLGDLLRVLALSPILALAGGSLGVLFIGFVRDPRVAGVGVALLVFPQMFLAGALIPIGQSSGLLGILANLMPMTYSIDLARNIFYAGKAEYAAAVLHPAWLDLGVTVALFVIFTVVGTYCFVRADRNRCGRPGTGRPQPPPATVARPARRSHHGVLETRATVM
jgi:ABC-2 type transport system permease protein